MERRKRGGRRKIAGRRKREERGKRGKRGERKETEEKERPGSRVGARKEGLDNSPRHRESERGRVLSKSLNLNLKNIRRKKREEKGQRREKRG